MAHNIAKLVNALKEDENSNTFWWEVLGSINIAKQVVLAAFKEEPTEKELSYLVDLLEIECKSCAKIQSYKECLEELRKELIIAES